ncbi:MAG: hypothetical protein H6732_19345 [Alphaproteobacteria bacterium]|nr:hypothetical protein [Alphaproteobacteria bacterium]
MIVEKVITTDLLTGETREELTYAPQTPEDRALLAEMYRRGEFIDHEWDAESRRAAATPEPQERPPARGGAGE